MIAPLADRMIAAATSTRISDLERQLAERDERVRVLEAALIEMVEWHGPEHDEDCPGDDTCDCSFKPMNDRINAALASKEK